MNIHELNIVSIVSNIKTLVWRKFQLQEHAGRVYRALMNKYLLWKSKATTGRAKAEGRMLLILSEMGGKWGWSHLKGLGGQDFTHEDGKEHCSLASPCCHCLREL